MSTILKALRRLEEDKKTRAAMSLDSALLEPSRPRSRRNNLVVSVAAGIAAAIGVMAIVWSLSGLWIPHPVETAAVAPTPIPAEPLPPEPVRITVPIADAPRPDPTTPVPLAEPDAGSRIEVFANAADVRRQIQSEAQQKKLGAAVPQRDEADAATPLVAGAPEPLPEAAKAEPRTPLKTASAPAPAKKMAAPEQEKTAVPTPTTTAAASASTAAPEPVKATGPAPVKTAGAAPVKAAAVAPAAIPKLSPKPAASQPREVKSASAPTSPQSGRESPAPIAPVAAAPVAEKPAAPEPVPSKAPAVASASLPSLAVQQIIWHPTPSRRVAVFEVEGESAPHRTGEGGIVAGFTVAKIGLSDVELVRDGVAITRRVGAN